MSLQRGRRPRPRARELLTLGYVLAVLLFICDGTPTTAIGSSRLRQKRWLASGLLSSAAQSFLPAAPLSSQASSLALLISLSRRIWEIRENAEVDQKLLGLKGAGASSPA